MHFAVARSVLDSGSGLDRIDLADRMTWLASVGVWYVVGSAALTFPQQQLPGQKSGVLPRLSRQSFVDKPELAGGIHTVAPQSQQSRKAFQAHFESMYVLSTQEDRRSLAFCNNLATCALCWRAGQVAGHPVVISGRSAAIQDQHTDT